MPLDLVATLSDLVAIPSVNPMGRNVAGPEFFEHRVTDYLEQLLRRFQIPTFRQPIAPLRENLLARIEGDVSPENGGELLLFEAHQDTVGVEGMTIEPWIPDNPRGPPLWPRILRCQRWPDRHAGSHRAAGRRAGQTAGGQFGPSPHRRFGLHGQ